jgi:predicted MPP superfamily phosphohydrolase
MALGAEQHLSALCFIYISEAMRAVERGALGRSFRRKRLSDRIIGELIRLVFNSFVGGIVIFVANRVFPTDHQDWFEVSYLDLTLPNLPPEFEGYRLVQISDFHIGTFIDRERLAEIVARVNAEEPDLVAITGDFVTYHPEQYADDLIGPLRRLRSRDGVLGILGNHDHWTDAAQVREIMARCGIADLSNTSRPICRGDARITFVGVDDYMAGESDLPRALAQVDPEGAAILLAHEPDFADISAKTGRFDLQLSGHTHGGQINLPKLGSLYLPRYGRKYPSGLYEVNHMQLYTTRGLGTAELQLRVNCPAEIAVFTLHTP